MSEVNLFPERSQDFEPSGIWPMPPLLAPVIGLFIGLLIGGIPGVVGATHHIYIFAPVCLSMAMFFAGVFGAFAAFRRRQTPKRHTAKRMTQYVFMFLVVGCLLAQILFTVRNQFFLVSYFKLLFFSLHQL
jgi:uncharacterized membrane protein